MLIIWKLTTRKGFELRIKHTPKIFFACHILTWAPSPDGMVTHNSPVIAPKEWLLLLYQQRRPQASKAHITWYETLRYFERHSWSKESWNETLLSGVSNGAIHTAESVSKSDVHTGCFDLTISCGHILWRDGHETPLQAPGPMIPFDAQSSKQYKNNPSKISWLGIQCRRLLQVLLDTKRLLDLHDHWLPSATIIINLSYHYGVNSTRYGL